MDQKSTLKAMILAAASEGEIVLTSGQKSEFYIDGKQVTLDPGGSRLVGEAVLQVAREVNATAVGGPTLGACPMVSAAGVLADQAGVKLKLFYVRKEAKGHGKKRAVEGPPIGAGDKALIVEDVVTTGGSLLKAIERVREETGAEVSDAVCIVDREAGGMELLAEAGVTLRPIFTLQDLK